MDKDPAVVLAQTAGFCPGVKKAIDQVLELAQAGKAPIYTLGPLIHNTQVIEMLKQKGIRAVDALDEIKGQAGVIVIRAHGITPSLEAEVRARGLEVIDSTCPLVKNVHSVIGKYAALGYATVIVGDKGHAEVVGLLGYAGERAFVVADSEEARRLPALDKVNIVAQTTQEEDAFLKTAETVKSRAREAVISNTICKPTRDRQRETQELAGKVDLMVIVGAKHSANTTRLTALCRRLCPRTIHIETEAEADPAAVRSARRIGITAGASTPGWMTDRVMGRIKELRKKEAVSPFHALERLIELLVDSCAYTGLSAVGLTYVCMKLQGVRVEDRLLILAGLFVFSLHLINRVAEKGVGAVESRKVELFEKHQRPLIGAAFISGLLALGLALFLGTKIFAVVFCCWILGALFPFRSLHGQAGRVDFPGSRDIVTALGWGMVCACLPALHQGIVFSKANYLAVVFAILLVFIRSVMLGISAVHSDMIVGRENFYKALGARTTYAILASIQSLLTAVLIVLLAMGWKSRLVGSLLAGNLAFAAGSSTCHFRGTPKGFWAEAAVDGQFLLLALLAWLGGRL
ncbi:MAG: 4-hydroxy-3-methylbut-2-enyl diphosphate reductase [Elusimicrobia bacterium]|nr:4-hydroxy-3-methylbut-2-enyl diphosphate reductase [Elusimicrobiota bacterium]